ncbi:MAG: aminodeoxychorismate synthase component I [Caldilineales bacterium]|nr:aminodeoxychorismate synthase component I [Caldilineales bacterium]
MSKNHTQIRALIRDELSGCWWQFENPVVVLVAANLDDVLPVLQEVVDVVDRRGLFATGFISYESAPAFDSALVAHKAQTIWPLLWFALFPPPQVLSIPPLPVTTDYRLTAWQSTLSASDYEQKIERIKQHIARGDTYQVNYTFRLRSEFGGDAFTLFTKLQQAQVAPLAAFIETPDFALCSASPELFFRLDDENILSRPMKGTAPRSADATEDENLRRGLWASRKDRAENVMIVDMIRNDLGRIARTGSVHVPRLFEVEHYPTVWQMTSSVAARTTASLPEILRALFPCASITGAPKVRTMSIIADLEDSPRGAYTGCIGYIAPERQVQFNVAIRTVAIDRRSGRAEYGVGSGIVWDSDAVSEYAECETKARILQGLTRATITSPELMQVTAPA